MKRNVVILVSAILVLCVSIGYVASLTNTAIDASGDVGKYPAVALDSTGIVHISYQDDANNTLKYCNNTGGSWGCETAYAAETISSTDISINSTDDPWIGMIDYTNDDIMFCTNPGNGWVCGDAGAPAGTTVWSYVTIDIDPDDVVHIAAHDSGVNDYYYCNNTGGSWSCGTLFTEQDEGGGVDMYIDSTGKIHAVLIDKDQITPSFDLKNCTNPNPGSWTCTNIEAGTRCNGEVSMYLDSNLFYHVICDTLDAGIRYCTDAGGSGWQCENITVPGMGANDLAIMVDGADVVHMIYENETSESLSYANGSFGSWSYAEIKANIGSPVAALTAGSITASKGRRSTSSSWSNDVHIAYGNETTNTELMYAILEGWSPANSAPTLDAKSTLPADVYTDTYMNLSITCSDANPGDTITAYWQTWLNNAHDEPEGSVTVSSGVATKVYDYLSGNYSESDKVKFEVWCGDGTENTTHENTTEETILNSNPTLDSKSYLPANVYTDIPMNVTLTCSDADAGDTITAYLQAWLNDAPDENEYSVTVSSGSPTKIYDYLSGNYSKDDTVQFEVWCGDGTANTTHENTTKETVINYNPTLGDLVEPTDPSTYTYGQAYQFNITVCDDDGSSDIDSVILDWDGSNISISSSDTVNSTCEEYYYSRQLGAGNYTYVWFMNDTSDSSVSQEDNFNVTKNTSAAIDNFYLNDTYISINESIRVSVAASPGAQVNLTVQTTGGSANYTLSYNGSAYTYDLSKTELGDESDNASAFLNVTRFWLDGQNYSLTTNSSTLSFDYATTSLTGVRATPLETYNSPSDAVAFLANYTTSGAVLPGNCSVTVGGSLYQMSLVSGEQYVSVSVYGWTAATYTYLISCTNNSYQTQTNSTGYEFIVRAGIPPAGDGDDGGGGGGGDDSGSQYVPQIELRTETIFSEIVCGDGICSENETFDSCSIDCKPPIASSGTARVELAFLGITVVGAVIVGQHQTKKKRKTKYKTV